MSELVAAAYDERAAEYIRHAGDIEQMAEDDRVLIERWRDATPGRLLDAGCGPGQWTALLHDGCRDVLGVDLSERFIAHARARYPRVRFEHGSFGELPVADASLGGILAWYSLIHTSPAEISSILAEFARVIAPDGSILIGVFGGTPRKPFDHAVAPAFFWNADALTELLEVAGLRVTASALREREDGEISRRPHTHVVATRRS